MIHSLKQEALIMAVKNFIGLCNVSIRVKGDNVIVRWLNGGHVYNKGLLVAKWSAEHGRLGLKRGLSTQARNFYKRAWDGDVYGLESDEDYVIEDSIINGDNGEDDSNE